MKPAAFDYLRAETISEVLSALAHPDTETKVLAGGQSLVTLMNLRLARPSRLVDIGSLDELDRVFDDVDGVVLGARVRHRTLESHRLIRERLPLVAAAAGHIGHVSIRNRGTLGGSLAHADPAGEPPLAMLVHDATVHVESAARGSRAIAAEDFFESVFTTTLEPDELLTWVSVPALTPGQGWGFVEYAPRHGDYAHAGAGCLVTLGSDGRVSGLRAGLMAVAARPVLVGSAQDVVGEQPSEDLWRKVAAHWVGDLDLAGDDPDHVRHLSAGALTEVLTAASRRASGHHSDHARNEAEHDR
ncbi:FAD binding domain-containing protein [Knoellia aerolata]|uniref:Carbon monoxide dehydrogenase n=1 Tax=Knoellia aerolata DSM 18566 TaxID=1385519 RepID=A0A0A0JW11_9MICO|nr:FAD binding domain-containing protein [Knoellia aerolata]KGN41570.1 carbon monoxide dehydrogenase [Knoellia aerolata DSM 18566]